MNEVPVAVISGGSSGLGLEITNCLVEEGYRVVIVGRNSDRLRDAMSQVPENKQAMVEVFSCDVTQKQQVSDLVNHLKIRFGGLDVWVNCVGSSDRGLLQNLTMDRFEELMRANVLSSLWCSQLAIPLLENKRGVILNIGSLASKVGSRYLGGYALAKHALAALTQQMRLELKDRGVHVCLLSPGPIRRADAGIRYSSQMESGLPAQASKPGGGTRLKGLDPKIVARAAVVMVTKRQADRVLPGYLRLLIGIGHLCPSFGDWLIMKFTSSKS